MDNQNTIKVYYEASVIGAGRSNKLAKTGINRVATELLHAIKQQGEVDIIPICRSYDLSRSLLEEVGEDEFNNSALIGQIKSCERLKAISRPLEPSPSSLLQGTLVRSILSRAKEKGRTIFNRLIDEQFQNATNKLINSNSPKNLVFHDTYMKTCLKAPGIHRIYTVYDLIPILYPDYFDSHMSAHHKSFLSSISSNDYILCISESTKNDLISSFPHINPDHAKVVHLAGSSIFKPIQDKDTISRAIKHVGINEEENYFLSICTHEPRKNIRRVVEAFIELHKSHQSDNFNIKLLLVGSSGWGKNSIFDLIKEAGMSSHILCPGFVSDEFLPALCSRALAFIYPSLYEGFGLPALEAMQCGCPVISSITSSMPEVVGNSGILIDPLDTRSLCQNMKELMINSVLRKKLGQEGLKRSTLFSWDKAARETISVYREALRVNP